MSIQLLQSPLLKNIQNSYEGLTSRDRFALQILVIALLLLVCYMAIWKPAQHFKISAQSDMVYFKNLVGWIKANQELVRQAALTKSATPSSINNSQALVSVVSAKAKQHHLSLKRFEPSGDKKIRVWLEKSSFNNTVLWLQDLEKNYKITVTQIGVDRDKSGGLVNIRLTLES